MRRHADSRSSGEPGLTLRSIEVVLVRHGIDLRVLDSPSPGAILPQASAKVRQVPGLRNGPRFGPEVA